MVTVQVANAINLDPIQIDFPPQEEPKLDINPSSPSAALTPEVASSRAVRAQFGMQGILPKTYQDYYLGFLTGQEEPLKQEAAAAVFEKNRLNAQSALFNAAGSGQISPELVTTAAFPERPSPEGIFEWQLSKQYTDALPKSFGFSNTPRPFTMLDEAVKEAPVAVKNTLDLGTGIFAKSAYAQKKLEEVEAMVKQESWPGYLHEAFINMLPGVSSLYLRQGLKGGFLGSNLELQAQELFALPYNEFTKRFDEVLASIAIDNPQQAVAFARAMVSPSDMTMNSVLEVIDIASIIPGKTLLKAGVTAGVTNTRNAIKSMARALPAFNRQPAQVVAAAASGDLERAAVLKTTAVTADKATINFDPTKDAMEALTDNFKIAGREASSNPGDFQDLANRLDQQMNAAGSNVLSTVQKMQGINTVPNFIASDTANQAYVDAIKTSPKYRGIDNQTLNVVGPEFNSISKTWMYEQRIGTADGIYFKNKDVAVTNMAMNGIGVVDASRIMQLQKLIKGTGVELDYYRVAANPSEETRLKLRLTDKNRTPDFEKNYKDAQDRLISYEKEYAGLVNKRDPNVFVAEQQGQGYYIARLIPMDEFDDIVRNNALSTAHKNAKSWRGAAVSDTAIPPSWGHGWIDATIGWMRTADEVLPKAMSANRHIATHGPNVLLDLVKGEGKPLLKLPHKYWDDFDQLVKFGQNKIDPVTGKQGVFFKGPGEVQDWYQTYKNRKPEPSEIEAYFAHKKLTVIQRTLENIRAYTDKARVGGETNNFIVIKDGQALRSPDFDAKRLDHLPENEDNVLIIGRNGTKSEVVRAQAAKVEVHKGIKEGPLQVRQIIHPKEFPLQSIPETQGKLIKYVVSDKFETRPLSWQQTSGSMHIVPESNYSLSQAIIHEDRPKNKYLSNLHFYLGDRALGYYNSKSEAEKWAAHYNEVNKLITLGKIDEAKIYNNKHLPIDWDEHYSWYQPSTNSQGVKTKPWLDLGEEVRVVPRGFSIKDIDKKLEERFQYKHPKSGNLETTFRDGRDFGARVEGTEPKELFTISEDKGTRGNPLLKYEPARILDPITTMDRGLSKVINSTFMTDVKVSSAEMWLAHASPWLKGNWRDAPAAYFADPKWIDDVPFREWSSLMSAWKKIHDFNGTPSNLENWLHRASRALAESVDAKTGVNIVPAMQIPFVRNPLTFIRSMAYRAYMGLGDPKQFMNQATTYVNVHALSPKSAPAASIATLLYTWSKINRNPAILANLDEKATMMKIVGHNSFKPGQFTEFMEKLEASGFQHVGGEHAYLNTQVSDSWFTPKIIKGKFGQFLDLGDLPFRLGAQSTRISSYAAAYLELRATKPTGALTRLDEASLLNRAATLDHNMSRASNSLAHTGIAAIPFQFFAYDLRLMDMMYGKRLTPGEKARLFGTSAVMYGIPVGGLGLFGFPISDFVHQKAIDLGYTIGADKLNSFFMEGFPAAMMARITGKWFNFSKFGAKGVSILGDTMDHDKTVLQVYGGASGQLIGDTWARSSGVRAWIADRISGNTDFKIKPAHWFEIAKSIAVVKDIWRMVEAIETGKWMSSHNVFLGDVDKWEAVFMTLMGAERKDLLEAYDIAKLGKHYKDYYDHVKKNAILEYRRGFRAEADGNIEQAKDFYNNADVWLARYPLERRKEVIEQAMEDNKSLIDILNFKHTFKDAPMGDEGIRHERLRKIQQLGR